METQAEKAQETEGGMDAQFVVLAEDEDGFALVQFESANDEDQSKLWETWTVGTIETLVKKLKIGASSSLHLP